MVEVKISWGECRDEEDWIIQVYEKLIEAGGPVKEYNDENPEQLTISSGTIQRTDCEAGMFSTFTWSET